jgi:hypothetical protein
MEFWNVYWCLVAGYFLWGGLDIIDQRLQHIEQLLQTLAAYNCTIAPN